MSRVSRCSSPKSSSSSDTSSPRCFRNALSLKRANLSSRDSCNRTYDARGVTGGNFEDALFCAYAFSSSSRRSCSANLFCFAGACKSSKVTGSTYVNRNSMSLAFRARLTASSREWAIASSICFFATVGSVTSGSSSLMFANFGAALRDTSGFESYPPSVPVPLIPSSCIPASRFFIAEYRAAYALSTRVSTFRVPLEPFLLPEF